MTRGFGSSVLVFMEVVSNSFTRSMNSGRRYVSLWGFNLESCNSSCKIWSQTYYYRDQNYYQLSYKSKPNHYQFNVFVSEFYRIINVVFKSQESYWTWNWELNTLTTKSQNCLPFFFNEVRKKRLQERFYESKNIKNQKYLKLDHMSTIKNLTCLSVVAKGSKWRVCDAWRSILFEPPDSFPEITWLLRSKTYICSSKTWIK